MISLITHFTIIILGNVRPPVGRCKLAERVRPAQQSQAFSFPQDSKARCNANPYMHLYWLSFPPAILFRLYPSIFCSFLFFSVFFFPEISRDSLFLQISCCGLLPLRLLPLLRRPGKSPLDLLLQPEIAAASAECCRLGQQRINKGNQSLSQVLFSPTFPHKVLVFQPFHLRALFFSFCQE